MTQPPSQPGPRLDLRGAVDLSRLSQQAPSSGSGGGGRFVRDVTEADFADVVQLSMTVPVVVDLWATWCGPCRQLSPVLERLAEEYGGRFLLAKVDVDANPQISQAFQVQSIPTVVAILRGQPVPLFQGAVPEPQVRQVLDELLRVAAENGVTGTLDGTEQAGEADDQPAPLPPLHQEAYDAIQRGDLDAAADAYRRALAESPADADARAGLAQVELMARTRDLDPEATRRAAADDPTDVEAGMRCADLDVLGGHVEDAFTRLVDLVRITSGEERETVRRRMLDLFEVVGPDDERVLAARRALANALF